MNSLASIVTAIMRAERVLICGHVMPDGDSLGSVLALGLALERLNKKVTMAGPDKAPAVYGFLPGIERFQVGSPPHGPFDTFIVLDCSVPDRIGKEYQELLQQDMMIIDIDHHAGSVPFGTFQYIDSSAAAVGEIIFDLLNELRLFLTPEIATCLYTAIMTDTGSFQYESTTPETLRRAAKLLEAGVQAVKINTLLYEEKPKAAILLLKAALNTLSFSSCGRVCWMTVTQNDLVAAGAEDEHTEGLVNYTRSIEGVQVGLLFRELSCGRVKISFRSKEFVDVNKLAALFGGGGHPRASGCLLEGDLNVIQKNILEAAVAAVAKFTL